MEIVRPSHEIWTLLDGDEILRHIEHCGRVAYQSDDRTTPDSAARFVWRLIQRGHESVLEHTNITVNFITDRATANELVRHRMAAFTQESTRYVKYDNTRICLTEDAEDHLSDMLDALVESGGAYSGMIQDGCAAQTARRVLPMCLATQIVMTANLREWRHVLRVRTARDAHPDMRALMIPLLTDFKNKIPVVFDDILTDTPTVNPCVRCGAETPEGRHVCGACERG